MLHALVGVDAVRERLAGGKDASFQVSRPSPRGAPRAARALASFGVLRISRARARALPPSQKVALAEDIIKHARNEPLQELGASILMTLTAHDPPARAAARGGAIATRGGRALAAAGLGRFLRAVVLMLKWGLPPTLRYTAVHLWMLAQSPQLREDLVHHHAVAVRRCRGGRGGAARARARARSRAPPLRPSFSLSLSL